MKITRRIQAMIDVAVIGARWGQYLTDCAALCIDCRRGRKVYRDGDYWFHRLGRHREPYECDAWKLHDTYRRNEITAAPTAPDGASPR